MRSILDPLDTTFRGVVDRMLEALGPGADANAGSVVRTLIEAYAREMATFYAILERAHQAGYLDTADGDALDSVVAILGVERARAGRLTGQVEFSRISPTPQDIAIPAGHKVTGVLADGALLPLFATAEDAVLARGTTRVVVDVQEIDGGRGDPPALINPGALTIMPRPILGIESVTNLDPLRRTSNEESDDHLRARARWALRQSQMGTVEAIRAAIGEQGVSDVEVREPDEGPPGVIDVLVRDPAFEHDLVGQERVRRAIRATKAAGVRARVHFLRTVFLQPTIVIDPADPGIDARGFDRLRQELSAALAAAVERLPSETNISRRKLEAIVFGHPGVADMRFARLHSFTLGPDERYPLDPTRQRQITRGRGVTADGDVIVSAFEHPRVDLERWPPVIARYNTPLQQLDLVVRADADNESVRNQIRTALNGLAMRLPDLQDKNTRRIYDELRTNLAPAGVTAILLAVITDAEGASRTVDEEARLDSLAVGPRLVLGGLEIVTEGG